MRFIPNSCLKEGMIIGKNIYNANNNLMLSVGSILDKKYIKRLNQLNLNGVYISDEISKNIEIKEIISENLKQKTVKKIKSLFVSIPTATNTPEMSLEFILIEEMIDNILANKDLMVNMVDLKVFDDYTYYHSVNVATLSLVMGVSLKLKRKDLFELGVAALLHDIGKVFVPKEILHKPSKLTDLEFKQMKEHSKKGYDYLKKHYQISTRAYVGVKHHHEKYNGEGYPDGLSSDNISLFGRIITIADVYDALTSKRTYRCPMLPSDAIEYLLTGYGVIFDPHILEIFLKKVAPYPIGSIVLLSNNIKAIVTKNYEVCTTRPQIQLIDSKEYIELKDDKSYLNVTIIGLLE